MNKRMPITQHLVQANANYSKDMTMKYQKAYEEKRVTQHGKCFIFVAAGYGEKLG